MSALPSITRKFIPYDPDQKDYDLFWADDSEEKVQDFRRYELIDGEKVYLHCNLKLVYEDGVTQGEGTYLNGYREGIWRYFNRKGVLINAGSYNKRNERWGKWRFYEDLNGKPCLQMIVDIRGEYERYWIYDMDGKLTHRHLVSNMSAPIEEHVYRTEFYEPTGREWPSDY